MSCDPCSHVQYTHVHTTLVIRIIITIVRIIILILIVRSAVIHTNAATIINSKNNNNLEVATLYESYANTLSIKYFLL